MHDAAFRFATNALRGKTYRGVVEFGSRNVNGSIRPHVSYQGSYVGVDIKPGPDVDVVQDAAKYLGDPVGLVICMETLEHAPNWADIVHSAARNLMSHGEFIMTCASNGRQPHSAIDGGPLRTDEYYQNVSMSSFEAAAKAAGLMTKRIEYRPELGDLYYLGEKR